MLRKLYIRDIQLYALQVKQIMEKHPTILELFQRFQHQSELNSGDEFITALDILSGKTQVADPNLRNIFLFSSFYNVCPPVNATL